MSEKIHTSICKVCNKPHYTTIEAVQCCKKYICDDCGCEVERYHTKCDDCIDKMHYSTGRRLSYKKYAKKYPDYMLFYKNEFYSDMEDFLQYCENHNIEIPQWVYGTCLDYGKVNSDNILDEIENDMGLNDWDDIVFSDEARKEFREFVEKFNKEHAICAFYQDKNIIVEVKK